MQGVKGSTFDPEPQGQLIFFHDREMSPASVHKTKILYGQFGQKMTRGHLQSVKLTNLAQC